LVIVLRITFGEIAYNYRKGHLEKLSPIKMIRLSQKASSKKDVAVLEKIIHPDSDITIKDVTRKLTEPERNAGFVEKAVCIIFGIRIKADYQKILGANTAEVGSYMYSIYWPFAKKPIGMMALVKDDGIWKVHGDKWDWGKMLEQLKQNPSDASSYYLYSQEVINEWFLAYRFKKKYYELDPDGFWVTDNFIEKLKADEEKYEINYKEYERELLVQMKTYSPDGSARDYINLARIFMFHNNNNNSKAEEYLIKAENVLQQRKYTFYEEVFDRAWDELQLRKEGKYVDPLDELDKLRLMKEK
jgi:hypothetical protein